MLERCWEGAGTVLGRCWEGAGMVLGRCWDSAGTVMAWLVLTQHQPKREEPMCLETSLCDVSRFAFILFVLVVSIHINMVMCLLTCVSQRSM